MVAVRWAAVGDQRCRVWESPRYISTPMRTSWTAAAACVSMLSSITHSSWRLRTIVASAVMNEREKCGMHCDGVVHEPSGCPFSVGRFLALFQAEQYNSPGISVPIGLWLGAAEHRAKV